ncbi:cytohesin-3-like protein [Labeo rohita]|uniref:Cytohesin-3-like protein n=1 Tax=Labeo rohita TaxID=84645 RepID=A0A498NKJ6_LABRO|nr:cytohesin-3-like protein [Labeo rohita]RXN32107.1 cytohesin-3-like protein [Labeo rohita]
MGTQRKDSFLWGKAPLAFIENDKRQTDVHKHVILDDIQKLRLEIENMMTEIQTMEADDENKNVMKNKRIQCGKKKFNMDPKKGIQYLVDNNLLEWKPEAVAEFLYKEEGLNKTAIGDFLGEREEIHLQILQAFVHLHEFSNLNLVQALRQFLWSFRLPGEAQKIDRMMEAFALRYCTCNDGVFQSTDTCYILSFAIIMLNTSLHNPNVKDKTTLQRFISMNRGINNGEDLPEELLEDQEPKGIIPLENLCVREVDDAHKQFCLELFSPHRKGETIKACKTETDGRLVMGKHHSYRLSAASEEEREDWVQAIRACITKDPFYDLVSARKKKIIGHTTEYD